MLNQGIDFLKDKKYEEFIEDGCFVTSVESIFIFDRICDKLSQGGTRRIAFPEQIVWVNGAPGSGKGTNTRNIMRAMGIPSRPIVVSDLLNDEKFKQKIDQGMLADDEEVALLLFEKIFEESHTKGIIVDGFPRTKIQAEFIQLLFIKSKKITPIKMISVILLIDEKTSIQRQLDRGKSAIEYNKKVAQEGGEGKQMEVRKTDSDPETARKRYNTFREETYEALKLLRKISEAHDIDAKGSFDEVGKRIVEKLKKR